MFQSGIFYLPPGEGAAGPSKIESQGHPEADFRNPI